MPNHREKNAQLHVGAWPTDHVFSRRVMHSTEEGKLLISYATQPSAGSCAAARVMRSAVEKHRTMAYTRVAAATAPSLQYERELETQK